MRGASSYPTRLASTRIDSPDRFNWPGQARLERLAMVDSLMINRPRSLSLSGRQQSLRGLTMGSSRSPLWPVYLSNWRALVRRAQQTLSLPPSYLSPRPLFATGSIASPLARDDGLMLNAAASQPAGPARRLGPARARACALPGCGPEAPNGSPLLGSTAGPGGSSYLVPILRPPRPMGASLESCAQISPAGRLCAAFSYSSRVSRPPQRHQAAGRATAAAADDDCRVSEP